MKPFLVVARVRIHEYMQRFDHESGYINDTRIVMAETKSQAEARYREYWEIEKTEVYATSYLVWDITVTEPIL